MPFLFIFTALITLPIKILSAEIIITDTVIIFSETFVYVSNIEINNKLIILITNAIPVPIKIFIPAPPTPCRRR